MKTELIIIGASGHGKVVADLAEKCGYLVKGFLDDNPKIEEHFGYPVLGEVQIVEEWDAEKDWKTCKFVIAIGENTIRRKIAQRYRKLQFATLVHPAAVLGKGVCLGAGTVVMAGAVINADAKVGDHCIINTGAIIEHDCMIRDYTHISPGAVVAGTVKIGGMCHIGAGAVVRNNITVCEGVTVGVGAAVVKNILEPGIYVGVPAGKYVISS